MKLRHYLKKHPNTIVLRISKIEMVISQGGMKLYKFTLSRPIEQVIGSIVREGTEVVNNVTELWLHEDNIDKVKAFTVGNYGNMKMKLVNLFLDVSKERTHLNITVPQRVWITPEPFARFVGNRRKPIQISSIVNRLLDRE